MSWIDYPRNKPTISKTYLVTIERPINDGNFMFKNFFTFKYVAYYNSETDNWHKCDGFVDEDIKEEITDRITGWIDVPTYLI